MKKLAVIILNWNGLDLLKKFLPIAVAHTCCDEADIIVADNGSTDGSCLWVKEHFPKIRLIEFQQNYGFAEGYNHAIDETSYPYSILLNSDVEVGPGWWQPLLSFMESHPDVGAVQPKIKSFHDKEKFEYAGAAGGLIDALGYPYCRGRLFDRVEIDRGQYDGIIADIAWASGAALMVRTDLYKKLGGLDSRFFAHMEEIDLCFRIIAAGYRVCVIPDSEIFHVGGASLSHDNPKKTYLNFRNNLLLLHKNLPKKKGRRVLITRRLVDTIAFLMYVVKVDFPNAKAILKAHKDFRKMKKYYVDHPHFDILKKLPGTNRYIVFDRFLLRKTK